MLARLVTMLGRTLGPSFPLDLELSSRAAVAFCDATQLEAAVLNLVLNARYASAPAGPITVAVDARRCDEPTPCGPGTLAPGDYLRVRVRDRGVGVASELIDRIWEPFVSTKDEGDHSGMGLSMVCGFALQSGGGVEFDSEPGVGSCVSLWLPARDRGGEGRARTGGERALVLAVDDEELVLRSLARLLERLGFDVMRRAAPPRPAPCWPSGPSISW